MITYRVWSAPKQRGSEKRKQVTCGWANVGADRQSRGACSLGLREQCTGKTTERTLQIEGPVCRDQIRLNRVQEGSWGTRESKHFATSGEEKPVHT